MRCFLSFFPLIFLLWSCNSFSGGTEAKNNTTEGPKAIALADLQFTDLEGKEFTGKKYAGKPVFIHFWATWCRPCVKEMPDLNNAMSKTEGITYIFPSDENLKRIDGFRQKNHYPFEYLQITSGFETIGVSSLPTTYIFDKNGFLKEKIIGSREWDTPEMVAYLNSLSNN